MDPTKTRIWNADQLGLSAPRDRNQPSATAAPRAAGESAQTAATPAVPRVHRPATGGYGAAHSAERSRTMPAADGCGANTSGGDESRSTFRVEGVLRASTPGVSVVPRRDETLPSHRHARASRAPEGVTSQSVARRSELAGPSAAGSAEPGGSAPPVAGVGSSEGARGRRSSSRPPPPPPPPPPPRRARASVPPPAPGTLTARWSAHVDARGPLVSTRIMPIELLLPSGSRTLPQPRAASVATAQPRFRTLKRVGGHVLLATLTLLAIASWKLPLGQYVRARYLPPSAATRTPGDTTPAGPEVQLAAGEMNGAVQAPLPAAVPDAPRADEQEETARVHGEGAVASRTLAADSGSRGLPRRRGKGHTPGLTVSPQRRAVELVIGGDFAGAEEAYRMLASEHPDADAYREAARILAARRRK